MAGWISSVCTEKELVTRPKDARALDQADVF